MADQQEKHSASNQQSTQNTDDQNEATQCRRSRGFDPAPFWAAPMPNQKARHLAPLETLRRLAVAQKGYIKGLQALLNKYARKLKRAPLRVILDPLLCFGVPHAT
jgi:hypothetical protein